MKASPLVFHPRAEGGRLTHQLFRFPAKFHPPIVDYLLDRYADGGETVLDCFCGSGTLLVEAAVRGVRAIGSDVDPLAAFVSAVKSRPLRADLLEEDWDDLRRRLEGYTRPDREYERRRFVDLSPANYQSQARGLVVPRIPNLFHWFRKYVVVDLARIRGTLSRAHMLASHRQFFELCFASIIRSSSNADPVPVSGLEVTAHMRELEISGRTINPFDLFFGAVDRGIRDMEEFSDFAIRPVQIRVLQVDATEVAARLRRHPDVVITSPPYNSAVDYYRRHQLEMFWLDLTRTHEDRLRLLDGYIGRPWPPATHRHSADRRDLGPGLMRLESRMRSYDARRATSFRHYAVGMQRVLEQISMLLAPKRVAVFVVGDSRWPEGWIRTVELLEELASPWFQLIDVLWYPLQDRYMSYERRNGADISREYVVVLRRRRG